MLSVVCETYEKYLTKKGASLTTRRLSILKESIKTKGHFSAEDLIKMLARKDLRVSRATVYRTLNELVRAKLFVQTAFGEKHRHFEFVRIGKSHHHAFCIKCKQNLEFIDLGEEKLYRKILQTNGFVIIGHEMHFYGLCKNCNDPLDSTK